MIRASKQASFTTCLESTRHFVREASRIRPIRELATKDVYLFAYFYDRGVQAGVIEWTDERRGGEAKVIDYRNAAERGL